MPELGPYATEVLSAYAVSLILLAALIARSWQRFRAARARLAAVEAAKEAAHG